MASDPKLLEVTPDSVLTFDNDFRQQQQRLLTLRNTTSGNVAFKVKTTALKAYLVRPSNAVLLPGESKDVQIMLQKLSEKPKNHEHRFLVQAMATSEAEISSKDAWAEMQRTTQMQEYRLSVVFAEGGDDLKHKYEELEAYTRKLEAQKSVVEAEIKRLESSGSGTKKKGFALWQVVFLVVLALFLAKVYERFQLGKNFKAGSLGKMSFR